MINKKKYIFIALFFALSLLIFSFLANAENETGTESETRTATETTTQPTTTSTSSTPTTETTSTTETENQDQTGTTEKQETSAENNQNSEAQLSIGAGITPDSPFYFVEDKILTQFRGDSKNREKKIAEIEAMVNERKIPEAREALERYKKYASYLENEVDPDKSEEAKRSAAAIRNKINEIESQIPDDVKKEFVDEIKNKEKRITTAAELSKKIRDLCESLSNVDPVEYERVCKTNENAPKWQRNLDKKLTEEQRKEAEKFFQVMSACFKDPATCKCEEINVNAFVEKCGVVAPLAAKCEKGDEEACEKMDEESEGIDELLPEHLQDVLADVEERYGEAKNDLHMPSECREASVKNPKECEKIMIRTHAPEECIQAFDKGEISFNNPRQFEKACQEIMFKLNAPEECVAAGLKDPRECGKLMFKTNAPEECIDAGLTGESRSDDKKCRELMESKQGERGGPGRGYGFALGRDCNGIENKDEKLKCFEEIFNNAQQQHGFQGGPQGNNFGGKGGPRGGWPGPCQKVQAFTRESCEKIMTDESNKRFQETRRYEENFASSCHEKGGRWDCGFGSVTPENPCRCFFDDQFRPPQGQFPNQPQQPQMPRDFQCPPDMSKRCEGDKCFCVPPEQPVTQPTQPPQTTESAPATTTPTTDTSGTTSGSSGGTEGSSGSGTTTESSGSTSTTTTSGGSTGGTSETSGTSGTTGSVIGIDNEFLDYYFK